jgi:hypothetical protein
VSSKRELQRQIKAVMASLTAHVGEAVRRIAVEVTAELTAATPVDTGWARANWIPYLGVNTEKSDPVGGSARSVGSAAGAQARGVVTIVTAPAKDLANKGAVVINAVPYIGILNDGHSQQAPAGFVQVAIDKALGNVRRQEFASIGQTIGGGE